MPPKGKKGKKKKKEPPPEPPIEFSDDQEEEKELDLVNDLNDDFFYKAYKVSIPFCIQHKLAVIAMLNRPFKPYRKIIVLMRHPNLKNT